MVADLVEVVGGREMVEDYYEIGYYLLFLPRFAAVGLLPVVR